ncbi:MAG: inositol monophosphatase [Gammaproteobacteria bacterium]|jgi:fructose-1,6-bisphosphatase/inositol monophosphatase family enzyme
MKRSIGKIRPETETAIHAASLAVHLADSREGADQVDSKGGIDIVTATDVLCEDVIRAELTAAFPDCAIVGEERGGTPVEKGAFWLVDPICGTRPFASNVPLYCTNIALVENGEVTAAAVAIGKSGEILFAEKGRGAWMQTAEGDRPVQTSEESNVIWMGSQTELGANVVRNTMLLRRWYIWQFSSSVGYAYLAAGRIAGIVHLSPSLSPVHTAAGCFIAREAGAVMTDLDTGGSWSMETRSFLLGATPIVHDELREVVEGSR